VAENTIFGTQQAVWKERFWGKSVLEVCDRFALEFLSNLPKDERVELFCYYLLENCIDADSTFPLSFWSEMYCIVVEDPGRMWVIPCQLQCTVLHCALQCFCFCICTAK